MSEITALQDKLLMAVGDKIARYGFSQKPVGQSFIRKSATGFDAFHVSFIKHADDFDLTADLAIRIDELESLVNRDNALLKKAEKDKTTSIGAELGNLARGAQKRWTIRQSQDVEPVASEVMIDFASVALPYFKKFADREEVYKVLTDNTPSGWLHSPFHAARCTRAVGLAYLLKKPDLGEIIARNDAFLQEREDFGLASFRKFAQGLRA